MTRGPRGEGEGTRTSPLEAAVAMLGAVMVLALVGYMIAYAVGGPDGPPEFSFEHGAARPVAGGHLVEFTLRNEGGTTAATVRVSASLLADGRAVERSVATFDYLPARASRSGGVLFARDPSRHAVHFRVESYADP